MSTSLTQNNKRILFIIGTLRSGGKERRLIELLCYLKEHTDYEILVVLRQNQIDYPTFFSLNIPFGLLTEKYIKKDIRLPFSFFKICKEFKPDIIHSWGSMPASVAWPIALLQRTPHINSQITSAPPIRKTLSLKSFLDRINFLFSDVILSNSQAGLNAYKPPKKKSRVIYNGINFKRFNNLPDKKKIKQKYGIITPFVVAMVASFSDKKDFDLFVDIANEVCHRRQDISFVSVGDGMHFNRIKEKAKGNPYIIFTGKVNDVESFLNICDIGVLFSNKKVHGEGVSNTIIEYMALGKPVIANDAGGTNEVLANKESGYLITDENIQEIADMVVDLIEAPLQRVQFGNKGEAIVREKFSLERMGREFDELYNSLF